MNTFQRLQRVLARPPVALPYELLDPRGERDASQLEEQASSPATATAEANPNANADPATETESKAPSRGGLGRAGMRALGCAAYFLVPSFLQSGEKKAMRERVMTETSYLNGLRGLAAWLVFVTHLLYDPGFHEGYAGRPGDFAIQLPFLRLLFAGQFMVAIFFILSGFVLSSTPLRLARAGDSSTLCKKLSSAAFRRTPRLFLPLLPAMVGTAVAIRGSCYGDESFRRLRCLAREPTLRGQAWRSVDTLVQMLNPSSWAQQAPAGMNHLWTVPAEHRGSLVVFLLCLGLGQTRPAWRLAWLALLAAFFAHVGRYDTFLFVAGAILAERRLRRGEPRLDLADGGPPSLRRALRSLGWALVCLLGLFLGSWPDAGGCASYGFRVLCAVTPGAYGDDAATGVDARRDFWTAVGAVLLLLSLENLEPLQRPFTTPLACYMGDISFGFYIVHWTILFTLGSSTIARCREWLPYGAPVYSLGYWLGALLTTLVTLWAGDVYWRAFDRSSVRFARWLDRACGMESG